MLKYNIDIKFGFGQIGISAYMGELSLKKRNDSGFDINIHKPDISIMTRFPEIHIDTSACWADIGYQPPLKFAKYCFDSIAQGVDDYIYQKVAEGNALGDIEKGMTVQDVSYNQALPEHREINVDIIPKSRPQINVKEGSVLTKFTPGHVYVFVDPDQQFEYKPANVRIYLEKDSYINIKVVERGSNIDTLI